MSIDVFLSSNSRKGYSQDIVDLFAKPSGTTQQFRYASKWISTEVLKRVSSGAYRKKTEAVLCYIDQATKSVTPLILPIRFSEIVEVREHGSTFSIVFKLGDFCEFDDLRTLNRTLRSDQSEMPDYVGNKITGKYWLFDKTRKFNNIERCNELNNWEHLVRCYYQTPNFNEKVPFYRFESIDDLNTNRIIKSIKDNDDLLYTLDGGKKYNVSIYHFHPKDDFPNFALQVSSDDQNLVPLNGDSRVLDTRYDRKDYKFETKQVLLGANSSLSFRRIDKDSGKLIREDFLIRVNIRPSWVLVALYICLVAAGFSVPFIVRTFTDPQHDGPVIFAALFGGLIVGIATLIKEKVSF